MSSHELENAGQRIARAQLVASDLPIYFDELSKFDWDYEYSDANGVYERGQKQYEALRDMASASEDHARLFLAFRNHHTAKNRASWLNKDQRASYPIPELPRRPE
jgi:hypothetical protein